MTRHESSLGELVRAFAHILPGAGDVIVYGGTPLDVAALRQESVFTLNCRVPDASVPRVALDGGLQVIERRLSGRRLPLPPTLFAGAWARFAEVIDEEVVRELLRVLVPGGLMTIIGPASEAGTRESSYHLFSCEESIPIFLGMLPLAGSGGYEASLFRRSTDSDSVITGGCEFCPSMRFRLNKQAGLPGAAGVLWGNEEFLVIPDIAPITPGHLLLLTTRHYLSMGAIPEKSYGLLEDYISRIDRVMRAGFGKPALFIEHGATQPLEAGSCIDHAHWHCLPNTGAITEDLERLGMQGNVGQLQRAKELHDSHQPYFLARDHDKQLYFPADGLPCQFLRLVAATGRNVANPRWQNTLASADNRERYGETIRRTLVHVDGLLEDMNAVQFAAPLKEMMDE